MRYFKGDFFNGVVSKNYFFLAGDFFGLLNPALSTPITLMPVIFFFEEAANADEGLDLRAVLLLLDYFLSAIEFESASFDYWPFFLLFKTSGITGPAPTLGAFAFEMATNDVLPAANCANFAFFAYVFFNASIYYVIAFTLLTLTYFNLSLAIFF